MLRPQVATLLHRLREPRRFLQILAGPRQVGKTTIAHEALRACGRATLYASADGPSPPDAGWIDRQWDAATLAARDAPDGGVLVLDEVQKMPRWWGSRLVGRPTCGTRSWRPRSPATCC